jgi:hypothetical protein
VIRLLPQQKRQPASLFDTTTKVKPRQTENEKEEKGEENELKETGGATTTFIATTNSQMALCFSRT